MIVNNNGTIGTQINLDSNNSSKPNFNYPLPETCKELARLFPEWRTEFVAIFHLFQDDLCIRFSIWDEEYYFRPNNWFIAPTFHELWEKLPSLIGGKINNWLKLDKEYVSYYNYDHEDYLYIINIIDSHTVESIAQLLIKLKEEKLV